MPGTPRALSPHAQTPSSIDTVLILTLRASSWGPTGCKSSKMLATPQAHVSLWDPSLQSLTPAIAELHRLQPQDPEHRVGQQTPAGTQQGLAQVPIPEKR